MKHRQEGGEQQGEYNDTEVRLLEHDDSPWT
jgi:hypothetical protein